MKKTLLFVFLLASFTVLRAQVVYEDFEGGASDLIWTGLNGSFDGVVPNPYPDAVNPSPNVGQYTNNVAFDFNFGLGALPTPPDLSKFHLIKMKVWSPVAPTKVLFKFEGGGNGVEMFRDITVANQWVEYSFDMSPGIPYNALDKILISVDPFSFNTTQFYFDDIIAYEAIEEYETFENGLGLPWVAFDGQFNGPIANPDSNSVNGSDNVGQYIKKDSTPYSLLLADRGIPFDLSILNQFHLNVWAEAPTQVLLKLEGPGGNIERTKNIGLAKEWQDYTFDFSAAAENTGLTKAILFFDPGVSLSKDTYYFDNLIAVGQGPCKGMTLDPNIIDDFECNRNATYVNGWDSLSVVNNPDPNSVNTSAKVGKYVDPVTEQWAALLIDYQNPIDLSTRNQLNIKIWSPRVVPILFKLEGSTSPPKEIFMDASAAGDWAQYTIDFSGEASALHSKIVLFFNAGQDPQAGDVYYIDDIFWSEKTSAVLEDFETGAAFLPWEPLDQQTLLHGTFAVSDNPDPSGVNTSTKVGEYHKGTSAFSTLAAVAPGIIDISEKPQYNVDVWATNAVSVTFQLESVANGNKEVTRDIEQAAAWQTLSFDFTDYQGITDWASMRLIFNPGVAEEGAVYYFDNLTQSERTIDPCEGTVPVGNIIDDFECQRNHEPLAGAQYLSVVGNPSVTTANSSTYVGLYHDQANMPWDALCYDFSNGVDLSSFNQLSFQVLSPTGAPVLMKLEGGSSPAVERWTAITTPNEWETLTTDFSDQVGGDFKRVCIFLNAGVDTAAQIDYYIDNVKFAHAPFTGCIMNFDDAAFISTEWKYFPSDDSGDFELVPNPDPSGINTSEYVGKAVEKSTSGQPWQGMYTDLPAPIHFGSDKIVRMKVWSPQVATVTMKIEHPLTPGAPASSGDVTVPNTKANEWEELSWDFSSTPITDDGEYNRITLIFDINNIPLTDQVYYFDDVALTGGECGTVSVGHGPDAPLPLTISPNPVSDELRIDDLDKVSRLDIINLFGQRIATVSTGAANSMYVQVANLQPATYILAGYGDKGELKAISRFVKL